MAWNILAMGIQNTLNAFTGIGRARREDDATVARKKAIADAVTKMEKMVTDGKVELEVGLEAISKYFTDLGDDAKAHFDEQMALGQEKIESQTKSALDALKFQLGEAKIRGNRAERNYLEDYEKKLERYEKDFDKATTKVQSDLRAQRLGASGAAIAASNQSQEIFGRVVGEMEESKSKFMRGLGEQFSDVVRSQGFQTGEIHKEAARAGVGLRMGLSEQLQSKLGQYALTQFGAEETRKKEQRGFERELGAQIIGLETEEAALEAEDVTKKGRQKEFFGRLFGASYE